MSEKDLGKFLKVGRIKAAQGLRGDVFVHIFSGETSWRDQLSVLHTSLPDEEAPSKEFTVVSQKTHSKSKLSGLVVRLEGVEDRNQSEALVGRLVYVPESFLTSGDEADFFLREILSFKVIDASRGVVGEITGFSDNTAQDLIVITDENKNEFEVPLVEPILQKINFEKQVVFMDIPPGLVFGEDL